MLERLLLRTRLDSVIAACGCHLGYVSSTYYPYLYLLSLDQFEMLPNETKKRTKVLGYFTVTEAHNGDDDDDDLGAGTMAELKTTAEAARHLGVSPGY